MNDVKQGVEQFAPMCAPEDDVYLRKAEEFLANSAKMNDAPLPFMVAAAFKVSDLLRMSIAREADLKARMDILDPICRWCSMRYSEHFGGICATNEGKRFKPTKAALEGKDGE